MTKNPNELTIENSVVLLIDHHQPQIPHRSEDARSCANYDRRKPGPYSPPLLGTFGIVEGGV